MQRGCCTCFYCTPRLSICVLLTHLLPLHSKGLNILRAEIVVSSQSAIALILSRDIRRGTNIVNRPNRSHQTCSRTVSALVCLLFSWQFASVMHELFRRCDHSKQIETKFEQMTNFYSAMLCVARTVPSCGVCLSVCPSVLLSVTFVYCIKMSNHIQFFSPPGSHTILVFPH